MELAKSFEPADIERRWYPDWEAQRLLQRRPRHATRPDNFCILLPPPNVTGTLHMGHGFNQTLMDALTRYHRMRGDNTLWQPGTDHAGIATQIVVERQLDAQGISRHDLGREKFLEKVWEWKEYSGNTITHQMRRLGTSPGLDARALHDGCRPVEDRHRNLRPPVQRRPDLPRQAPGELGPEAAHRRFRPRSRAARKKTASCGTSAIRSPMAADSLVGRHHAPGNHARRHRRDGASGRRALQAPDRQDGEAAADRPRNPDHRRQPTSTSNSAPAASRSRRRTTSTTMRSASATSLPIISILTLDAKINDNAPGEISRPGPLRRPQGRRRRPRSPRPPGKDRQAQAEGAARRPHRRRHRADAHRPVVRRHVQTRRRRQVDRRQGARMRRFRRDQVRARKTGSTPTTSGSTTSRTGAFRASCGGATRFRPGTATTARSSSPTTKPKPRPKPPSRATPAP